MRVKSQKIVLGNCNEPRASVMNITQLEKELAEFNTSKMSRTVKSQTNLPVKIIICHLKVVWTHSYKNYIP